MKINRDKSLFVLSGNKKAIANSANNSIESEGVHELFGITTDSKLTFENHINKLCKKASQKLNALARISNLMVFDKRKITMKAIITSRISYCPLALKSHSKKFSKIQKLNTFHGRALTISNELLGKDNSVSNIRYPIIFTLQLLTTFLH